MSDGKEATTAGLSSLSIGTEYRSTETDLVADFYVPCLKVASEYLRAVGYFRSSVFLLTGRALVDFCLRGGKFRLVCSPDLEEEDFRTIEAAYEERGLVVESAVLREVEALLANSGTMVALKVLATLVKSGHLDVRLVIKPTSRGLFHEKLGLFLDSHGTAVSFKGSANETWAAFHPLGNFESIEVFRPWSSEAERTRVLKHQAYFESLWSGTCPGLLTLEFPVAARARLQKVAYQTLEEARDAVDNRSGKEPRPHQVAVLSSWFSAGRRGIVQHATGCGKTFTALVAIRLHVEAGAPALVIVPSDLLLKQWESEIRENIPSAAILIVGGPHHPFGIAGRRLRAFLKPDAQLGQRIVLATIQMASTAKFLRKMETGQDLLVVVDEVHRAGSSVFSRITQIPAEARLGLSATPTRYLDETGTHMLREYFGEVLHPVIGIPEAIQKGLLVPYTYHPKTLHLTEDEGQEWATLTARIGRSYARLAASGRSHAEIMLELRSLFLARSRVAKRAEMKPALAASLLRRHLHRGDQWLVYCEDQQQLERVSKSLNSVGIRAMEYHSGQSDDPTSHIKYFKDFDGVLLSIHCLDEGVDLPPVDRALILASSRNPREFVQRRGRVLRRSPGKTSAEIYDALVLPPQGESEPTALTLLKGEIRRGLEFARWASNRSATVELRRIAIDYGIELAGDGHLMEDG